MPTYEYKCDACRHRFEEVQSMSAKHLRRCPKCGKNRLQRLISSGAGLIFKGSGFYATEYKSSRSGGSSETKPETNSETKSDSKSDSKPAKKGETKASSSDSGSDKSCGSCGKTGPNVCD